uniref:Uncharacterized protein n=1 Tax=Monopterus albus TaxID=43700 RepID=A0A3Q3IUF6_MONAL
MSQSVLDSMPGASTGTVVITDPLNFWGGKRVTPRPESNAKAEPVFEPSTGKYIQTTSVFNASHNVLKSWYNPKAGKLRLTSN